LTDPSRKLAQQFVAGLFFVGKRHALEKLNPKDTIRELKKDGEPEEIVRGPGGLRVDIDLAQVVDPLPAEEFNAGLVELSQDLVVKEQQIEYLISALPGLDNSMEDQERYIKELEEELRIAEEQRLEAVREKDEVLAKLDQAIRSVRRP